MNIGIISDHFLDSGGAANFAESELETVKNLEKEYSNEITFYYIVTNQKVFNCLRNKNYNVILFNKDNFFNRISLFLNQIALIRKVISKFKLNSFDNFLNKRSINFLIFVTPSKLVYFLRYIDFVSTIWEIQFKFSSHLNEYKNQYFDLFDRDSILKFISLYSFKIFVGSSKSKDDFSRLYSCDKSRIIEKMTPSIIVSESKKMNIKLNENKIGNYLFYPAQFWSHKNHLYIVEAFLEFKKRNIDIKCVFAGADKGHLKIIKEKISQYDLDDYFIIHKYLSNEEIVKLYLNCKAVVIPSIVGTYTFPHVEAFYFEKIVLSNKGNLDKIFYDKILDLTIDDPKSLVNKYSELLENKDDKINKMIKSNKKFYEEKISILSNTGIYKNVIDQYLSSIKS